ncbi:hypothetical protein Q5752_005098 [Cryptotrichosporon argae]
MPTPLSVYGSIVAQSLVPLILGSFKSLPPPRPGRRDPKRSDDAGDDDDDDDMGETITLADSLLFPVMGSGVLLGLWALIKYGGKEWINWVLGVYFTGAGMFAFQSTVGSVVQFVLRVTGVRTSTYHIRVSSGLKQIFHLPVTLPAALLLPLSIALPAAYVPLGKPYVLSNVLALCLASSTLGLLRLDGFKTAFALLSLLLVYDIFWVFATPVMVDVARSIDAPIKILSPRTGADYAMLGLGDIVVPGLLVALCLRFDLARHRRAAPSAPATARFGKKYFATALVSYVAGLATTMVVMHTTRRAQPALLYLSPACMIGPTLVALANGELKSFWAFSVDGEPAEKRDDTIEPPSEVAARAREAAKAKVAELAAAATGSGGGGGHGQVTVPLPADTRAHGDAHDEGADKDDDSWMDNAGVVGGAEGKARKRKGKK